jgi:hypothetical protein
MNRIRRDMTQFFPSVFRALLVLWLCAAAGSPQSAHAQTTPVVVELYTSQGCSSCPPADALMHKLAKREDVIALALHVDYWDYIGWEDAFALPEHADRQRTYARHGGRNSIYTPQIIINGVDSIVGARGMEIADTIMAHKARNTGVSLAVRRTGSKLVISAEAKTSPGPMDVMVVRYTPQRDVMITRGENAGRQMSYVNIVENWQHVTNWSGAEPLLVETAISGDAPVVVLLQSADQGPIQAAAQLR